MMNKTMYAICMAGFIGFNIAPAYALSYTYESGANTGFYESTSVTADSISNSSNITVGSDGTITAYANGNVLIDLLFASEKNKDVYEFGRKYNVKFEILRYGM